MLAGLSVGSARLGISPTAAIAALLVWGAWPLNPGGSQVGLDRIARSFLLCCLVLLGAFQENLTHITGVMLAGIPAGVLSIAAIVRLAACRDRIPGVMPISAGLVAGCIALAASILTAAGVRMVLSVRSSMPIAPGNLGFLLVMVLTGAGWFGLTVHLKERRKASYCADFMKRRWIWERRYLFYVAGVVGLNYLRHLVYET